MVTGPFAEKAGSLLMRVSGGNGNDPASACLERREGRPAAGHDALLRLPAAGGGIFLFEARLYHH